jgi:hypothetical protein
LICGTVVLLVMVAIKNGWVLRESGMVGSCRTYASLAGGEQQERCVPGSLDGQPNLTGKGCVVQSTIGRAQIWLCPAPVASAAGGV